MGHVTLTMPLLAVICHRWLRFDTVYLHALTIVVSAIPEISLGVLKFKVCHLTLITPLLRVFVTLMLGHNIAYMHEKFDHYSFSKDMVNVT